MFYSGIPDIFWRAVYFDSTSPGHDITLSASLLKSRVKKKSRIIPLAVILALVIFLGGALLNHWLTQPITAAPELKTVEAPSSPVSEFDALFSQAVNYMQTGEYEQALKYWHRALVVNPAVAEVRVNMGFTLIEMGNYKAACKSFNDALEQNEYQANAYYGLAICNEESGNLEAALGYMKSFVHLAQPQDQAFLSKARSAIWEWESSLRSKQDPPPD